LHNTNIENDQLGFNSWVRSPEEIKSTERSLLNSIEYKYEEDDILMELKKYINSTYGEHYADGELEAGEVISDWGHGEGFFVGNIIKYAKRYGKKNGKNRKDLLKIAHYTIMALWEQEKNG